MCFNAEITASMLVLNFATGLWLQSRGQKLARTQIFYVFGIMELLQLIQYMVIDRCDSWVNQLATALSFIHICFQPLSVNVFVMREEPNRDVAKTVFGLCIMAGIFEAFRLPYLGLNSLPSWVRTYLPGLPDVALAGSPEVCAWEDICGPLTCARRGKLHLAWTVPLAPPAYFAPSGFVHFLLFFGPALVAPGVWHLERIAFVVVALLSGPVAAQAASYWAAGGEPGWRLEWAGVWCLFAVVQIILGVGFECFLGLPADRPYEPLTAGSKWRARWARLVRAGRIYNGLDTPLPPADGGAAGAPLTNGKAAALNGDAGADDDVARGGAAAARDQADGGRALRNRGAARRA